MKPPASSNSEDSPLLDAATAWVVRHGRGLTPAEQDEFSQWLAADPRHGEAFAESRWGWDELDRVVGLQTSEHAEPEPDLLKPRRRTALLKFVLPAVLGAAAAVAVGFWWQPRPIVPAPSVAEVAPLALVEERTLSDGSVVKLNRGTSIAVEYSDELRVVKLLRGEADFDVAKNPARPFIVQAHGVNVRAIGTRFNVRLDSASVEVLVTEGRVGVNRADQADAVAPLEVAFGMRTVVSLAASAPAPEVVAVPPAEVEARLAWQPRLLDFSGAPLAEIVAEFNRSNPVRVVIGDDALREIRLSATFRSDNVEGFVRLMESEFEMRARRTADEIVLMPAR